MLDQLNELLLELSGLATGTRDAGVLVGVAADYASTGVLARVYAAHDAGVLTSVKPGTDAPVLVRVVVTEDAGVLFTVTPSVLGFHEAGTLTIVSTSYRDSGVLFTIAQGQDAGVLVKLQETIDPGVLIGVIPSADAGVLVGVTVAAPAHDAGVLVGVIEPNDTGVLVRVIYFSPTPPVTPTYGIEIAHAGEVLGHEVWSDAADRLMSFSTHRGYSGPTGGTVAGTCTAVLDDDDGALDPTNGASPLRPVTAMMPVRLRAVYNGHTYYLSWSYIDGFTPGLLPLGANMTIKATDYIKRLAWHRFTYDMTQGGLIPNVGTGDALAHVLTNAQFPTAFQRLDGGNISLNAVVMPEAGATDMLNRFVQADPGFAFIGGDGKFYYLDRATIHGNVPIGVFGAFGQYPIAKTHTSYTDQGVYNRVIVGNHQIEDFTSQALYDLREYRVQGGQNSLIQAGDESTTAQYLLDRTSQPPNTVTAIEIDPHAMPDLWPLVLGSEIGQKVTLDHQLPGMKGAATGDFWIISIEHKVDLRGPDHRVTWGLMQVRGVA